MISETIVGQFARIGDINPLRCAEYCDLVSGLLRDAGGFLSKACYVFGRAYKVDVSSCVAKSHLEPQASCQVEQIPGIAPLSPLDLSMPLAKPPVQAQTQPAGAEPTIPTHMSSLEFGNLDNLDLAHSASRLVVDARVEQRRSWWYWPEYMISLGTHLVLVLVLAWITVQSSEQTAHTLSLSVDDALTKDNALTEMTPQELSVEADLESLDSPLESVEMKLTNLLPTSELALQSTLASNFPSTNRIHVDLDGRITSGRIGDVRAELLKRFGGTPETEAADEAQYSVVAETAS